MPLEIRELIITASIKNNDGNSSGNNAMDTSGAANINEIADRVLEIIKQKSER